MGNTTKDLVLVIAPELASIAPLIWDTILADVALEVGTIYGTKQEIAQRYLAAHKLTLSNPESGRNPLASGPITSEKTGQLAVSYGSLQNGAGNNLDSTIYGQEFKRIRDSCFIGIKVVKPGVVSSA